jgi:spore maturation protein CgeB
LSVNAFVRAALLRVRPIAALNRKWKARALRSGLDRLKSHYSSRASTEGVRYSREAALHLLCERLACRPLVGRSPAEARPRIFWAGTNEDQDNSGLLQGLRTVGAVVHATKADGSYGLRSVAPDPRVLRDSRVVRENGKMLLDQVRRAHGHAAIDVLIGQLWANYLDVEVLAEIRRMGIVVVNIAMDDRLPQHWASWGGVRLGSVGLGAETDLVLTTTREACLWYHLEGVPAVYWPLASDPTIFHPAPDGSRPVPVCFVGARYGIRGHIVTALQKSGIRVDAYGPGWPAGRLAFAEAAALFGRSRIVLGSGTVGHADDVFTLKLRDFDGPMSGALYITHRNPDLFDCFEEGREIACFADLAECVRTVRYYLDHEPERARVADAGRTRALREHTWSRRFMELLADLGGAWPESSR